jgi:hypothetical protein
MKRAGRQTWKTIKCWWNTRHSERIYFGDSLSVGLDGALDRHGCFRCLKCGRVFGGAPD